MLYNGEKFGAFIVPTGVGASIGGFAGDAGPYARKFAKVSKLLVNPNVVNAGVFSAITDNMLYVEGYSINQFFKGHLNLISSENNKIGIVFDKAIPQDVLNIHINTLRAVKAVYGLDAEEFIITEKNVGVGFKLENNGISTGSVENVETLLDASRKLLDKGCHALALVCMFDDPEDLNSNYSNGIGTDPVGGVEAVLSHFISKELQVPCAHSPAFEDYRIYPELVNARAASEYITPTFLPCILLGLSNAPLLSVENGISVECLDYLIMPYNSLGSVPVFEALKRNIPVFAIKENNTVLNVCPEKISEKIIEMPDYSTCYDYIVNNL